MAKRSRAELEAENEQLREQVTALTEALTSAIRTRRPIPATDPYQWLWQQPGDGVLPGGLLPGGPGPQITCNTPPPNVTVSLFQTMGAAPLPMMTEYFVGDISEQHDQP